MDLEAMKASYNSIEIFLSLVSIFNFNFNRQYSSPNCHSKSCHVGKHHRVQSKIFFEPFECFGRVYWVHEVPEPVDNTLIWISKHRLDDDICWEDPFLTSSLGSRYGHQIDVLRSK
jgi:hypothetical protein